MKIYHSQKLNADDIQKFLKDIPSLPTTTKTGRLFQLTENNTKLKYFRYLLERDKNLSEILEKSKEKIQYSETKAQYNVHDNQSVILLN